MYKPNWTRTVASRMSIPMCGSCLLRQPMKGTPGELGKSEKGRSVWIRLRDLSRSRDLSRRRQILGRVWVQCSS